jgi:hypothetical protein
MACMNCGETAVVFNGRRWRCSGCGADRDPLRGVPREEVQGESGQPRVEKPLSGPEVETRTPAAQKLEQHRG